MHVKLIEPTFPLSPLFSSNVLEKKRTPPPQKKIFLQIFLAHFFAVLLHDYRVKLPETFFMEEMSYLRRVKALITS